MKKVLGVVGFCDNQRLTENKVTYDEVYDLVATFIGDYIEECACNGESLVIVSGLTTVGICGIIYELASEYGLETVGIAPEESLQYDSFDVDVEIITGINFGDESETLVDYVDVILNVLGGEQSNNECDIAIQQGKQVIHLI